jgi:hypothetical protein
VAAGLVATAMSTGEMPGVPGCDRTPKIIEQKAPVDDRRFLH